MKMTNQRVRMVSIAACLIASSMIGCASNASASKSQTPGASGSGALQPFPAADPALEPLSFLAGAWALNQPKGAMIEEHWTRPRGTAMVAMFRRVRADLVTPFYEFTQIVKEKDGVILRQMHVHDSFDTDPERLRTMTLRLEKTEPNSASFVPVDDAKIAAAGSLARVTYTLVDQHTLVLKVESKPKDPKPGEAAAAAEPALEFRMTRIRGAE